MRVAVHSAAPVGGDMSSPAIRAYQLARELGRTLRVTLVAPGESAPPEGVRLATAPQESRALGRALAGFDAVLTQRLPPAAAACLSGSGARVVYDLYTTTLPEGLASLAAGSPDSAAGLLVHAEALAQRFALATGDAFVCTSERQRDFWLGMLGLAGRLDPEAVREDRLLRQLIDVVPFGLPSEPPAGRADVLRGVVPGIGEEDRILLWAGGITDWTDAETVIRAVDELSRRRDDVKLFFLGAGEPPRTATERRAIDLAAELRQTGRSVFFSDGWASYDARQAYLLEADLGVAAYFDTLEARFAYRARLLDYFWAELPVVTTRGDTLGELVAERQLGAAVPQRDPTAFAAAVESLLDSSDLYATAQANLEPIREELAWPNIVDPLRRLLAATQPSGSRKARLLRLEDIAIRARISYERRGAAGLLRRQAARFGVRSLSW